MSILSVRPISVLRTSISKWYLAYTVGVIAIAAISLVLFDVYYLSHQAYVHLRVSYKEIPAGAEKKRVIIHAQIVNTGMKDAVIKDLVIRETADGIKYSEIHQQWFTGKILKSKGMISWDTNLPEANYTHEYTVELTTYNDEVFASKPKRFR